MSTKIVSFPRHFFKLNLGHFCDLLSLIPRNCFVNDSIRDQIFDKNICFVAHFKRALARSTNFLEPICDYFSLQTSCIVNRLLFLLIYRGCRKEGCGWTCHFCFETLIAALTKTARSQRCQIYQIFADFTRKRRRNTFAISAWPLFLINFCLFFIIVFNILFFTLFDIIFVDLTLF